MSDTAAGAGDLDRFVAAQAESHAAALAELRSGLKRSHWMWYVFPQIAGLGQSAMARRYAIADRLEARAYLAHPVLGPRLVACGGAMLAWHGRRSAEQILGPVDAMKLRSCATLFDAVGGDTVFAALIDAFFDARDQATLDRL